ncbi:MAG: biopolymer transporter ExbD [Sandaracinaceae bacterium]|nr:biopolymer transporter ExbD [Sandaracinaceae bacterium]
MRLSPTQRVYVRKRTVHHELDPSEASGELNIVPFLDIVVNIIMFLLATTQAVLAIAQLDAQLPTLGRRAGGATDTPSSTLNLSVTLTRNGIIVSGSGGKLAPGCAEMQSGRVITVPMRNNRFDWEGLTTCARRVKSEFQDEDKVILSADPEIEFEHVVAAMDAMRAHGTEELFPNVLLSAGVR